MEGFRSLQGVGEARRGAAFFSRFAGAEQRRPMGVLTNVAALDQFLYFGWPDFQMQRGRLAYQGPLPRSCSCGFQHQPMTGFTETGFNSGDVPLLTRLFWQYIFRALSPVSGHVALRDGSVVFSTSPSKGVRCCCPVLLRRSVRFRSHWARCTRLVWIRSSHALSFAILRGRQLCGLGYVPARRLGFAVSDYDGMFYMADLAFVSVFIISCGQGSCEYGGSFVAYQVAVAQSFGNAPGPFRAEG